MRLADGRSRFELEVLRYESEFEASDDGEPAPDWVIVRGILVTAGDEPLVFQRAALDTEEARSLASWRRDVADGKIRPDPVRELSPAHIFFCEPEIHAWFLSRECDQVTTRWHFLDTFVDITVTSEQFGSAAAAWADSVTQFPDR